MQQMNQSQTDQTSQSKFLSNRVIRFVAERGSSRLLQHVEHLDKLYNVPEPESAKSPETSDSVVPVPAAPKLRYWAFIISCMVNCSLFGYSHFFNVNQLVEVNDEGFSFVFFQLFHYSRICRSEYS